MSYTVFLSLPIPNTFAILCIRQRGDCLENDRCETATPLDSLPAVVSASSALATPEQLGSQAQDCFLVEALSNTAWYEVQGDGSCLSASAVGDFAAAVVLFDGDDCDAILCRDENFFGNFGVVTWQSRAGVTYKLLVGGLPESGSGDFVLAVTVRLA